VLRDFSSLGRGKVFGTVSSSRFYSTPSSRMTSRVCLQLLMLPFACRPPSFASLVFLSRFSGPVRSTPVGGVFFFAHFPFPIRTRVTISVPRTSRRPLLRARLRLVLTLHERSVGFFLLSRGSRLATASSTHLPSTLSFHLARANALRRFFSDSGCVLTAFRLASFCSGSSDFL